MPCLDCLAELDHCHGTVVRHVDGAECTEPTCLDGEALHAYVVSCDDISPACAGCAAVPVALTG